MAETVYRTPPPDAPDCLGCGASHPSQSAHLVCLERALMRMRGRLIDASMVLRRAIGVLHDTARTRNQEDEARVLCEAWVDDASAPRARESMAPSALISDDDYGKASDQ
jgi:hypothetical protein